MSPFVPVKCEIGMAVLADTGLPQISAPYQEIPFPVLGRTAQ